MHPSTMALTERLVQQEDPIERVRLLYGAYKGDTAFVVSCGPSTPIVLPETSRHLLDTQLVLAVKQSYNLLPQAVDYHLLTQANLQKYSYAKQILVFKTTLEGQPKLFGNTIELPVKRADQPVNIVKDFKVWEFTKTLKRPRGPGVMTELGLYLPVHFGCRKIIVIGWDINLKELRHYYDDSVPNVKRYRKEAMWLYKAVPSILSWLKSRGVELFLCSPRSALKIPQIPPKELHKHLEV